MRARVESGSADAEAEGPFPGQFSPAKNDTVSAICRNAEAKVTIIGARIMALFFSVCKYEASASLFPRFPEVVPERPEVARAVPKGALYFPEFAWTFFIFIFSRNLFPFVVEKRKGAFSRALKSFALIVRGAHSPVKSSKRINTSIGAVGRRKGKKTNKKRAYRTLPRVSHCAGAKESGGGKDVEESRGIERADGKKAAGGEKSAPRRRIKRYQTSGLIYAPKAVKTRASKAADLAITRLPASLASPP